MSFDMFLACFSYIQCLDLVNTYLFLDYNMAAFVFPSLRVHKIQHIYKIPGALICNSFRGSGRV
jgi:hypothetical protein